MKLLAVIFLALSSIAATPTSQPTGGTLRLKRDAPENVREFYRKLQDQISKEKVVLSYMRRGVVNSRVDYPKTVNGRWAFPSKSSMLTSIDKQATLIESMASYATGNASSFTSEASELSIAEETKSMDDFAVGQIGTVYKIHVIRVMSKKQVVGRVISHALSSVIDGRPMARPVWTEVQYEKPFYFEVDSTENMVDDQTFDMFNRVMLISKAVDGGVGKMFLLTPFNLKQFMEPEPK